MANSVHGKKEVDQQIVDLTTLITKSSTAKILKGGSHKVLKDFRRALGKAHAEADFFLSEKVEQKIGGKH